MRRLAARSAGPSDRPCMRGLAAQISSTLATPRAVSRMAWTSSGSVEAGLGLELGEEAVDVVDVLGPLDLRDHDHVELVADLGDGGGEVVERPRRVERVDPGPELGVAEVDRSWPTSTRPGPGRLLVVGRDAVLEVAEEDVDLSARCRAPWPPSSGSTAGRSGSSATAGPGSPGPARAPRRRAGGRSPWGCASPASLRVPGNGDQGAGGHRPGAQADWRRAVKRPMATSSSAATSGGSTVDRRPSSAASAWDAASSPRGTAGSDVGPHLDRLDAALGLDGGGGELCPEQLELLLQREGLRSRAATPAAGSGRCARAPAVRRSAPAHGRRRPTRPRWQGWGRTRSTSDRISRDDPS